MVNLDKLRKELGPKVLVTSDEESTGIPFCVCCDFGLWTQDQITDDHKKQGRYLLGALPLCHECEEKCSPEGKTCLVNIKFGRKMTMSEVLKYIMRD